MEKEEVVYKGIRYYRYPNSKNNHQRDYYKSSSWKSQSKNQSTSLHRVIYEDCVGPIPKGYVVHHIDGNPLNNEPSNLETISKSDHQKKHNSIEKARVKAAEWHKSEEGRLWHKINYNKHRAAVRRKRYEHICECCSERYKTNRKFKSRWCSDRCRNEAYKLKRRSVTDSESQ